MVDSLLALSVKVNALYATGHLIEANVVEAFETCATDGAHAMVWHQEVLFPAHKQMFLLHPVLGHQFRTRGVFREWFVRGEACPVLAINLLVGAPFRMLCYKGVFAADYLALKVCG